MKRTTLILSMALLLLGLKSSANKLTRPFSSHTLSSDSLSSTSWMEIIPELKYDLFEEEILPLNLLNCTAENIENRYVILTWAEAYEDMPAQVYEIQRYDYDNGWITIQEINSAKGSKGSYSFLDRQPYRGHTFYRIVQFDQNGLVFGSEVLPVSLYDPLEYAFEYDVLTGKAVLQRGNGKELSKEVLIFDNSGEQVSSGVKTQWTNDVLSIEFSDQLSGMHIIKCGSFITQVFRPDINSLRE